MAKWLKISHTGELRYVELPDSRSDGVFLTAVHREIDCEMIDTDLSFERSEVEATLTAPIVSIKNPRAGTIRVPHANEVIFDDPQARGRVLQDR